VREFLSTLRAFWVFKEEEVDPTLWPAAIYSSSRFSFLLRTWTRLTLSFSPEDIDLLECIKNLSSSTLRSSFSSSEEDSPLFFLLVYFLSFFSSSFFSVTNFL
jgi:hypothetical protein